MKKVILQLLFICALMTSCKEEGAGTIPIADENIIELVALGSAVVPTDANHGYGITYYCYLNLGNDSVYIQRKIDPLEAPKMVAWAGTVKGLADNDTIRALIEAIHSVGNVRIKNTSTQNYSFNHRYPYAFTHKQANDERIFFSTGNRDKRIEVATDYIIHLQYNSQLNQVTSAVHEDSVMLPLIRKEGFNFHPLPPPPVKAIIKYEPPIEK